MEQSLLHRFIIEVSIYTTPLTMHNVTEDICSTLVSLMLSRWSQSTYLRALPSFENPTPYP